MYDKEFNKGEAELKKKKELQEVENFINSYASISKEKDEYKK